MKPFFWSCLKLPNANSITLTLVQWMQFKRKLSNCAKWANKLKVRFYWHYCSKFILTSAFICLQSNFLFQHGKKSMKTYHSPPRVSIITGKILITIIIWVGIPSHIIFPWSNRHKLFSVSVAEYASFSHQARTLKVACRIQIWKINILSK